MFIIGVDCEFWGNCAIDVSVDKEELIRFWKSSVSGYGSRKIFKDCSALRDRHFPTIWLISLKKLIESSKQFSHRCIHGQESSRYILEVIRIRIPDSDQTRLGGGLLLLSYLTILLLFCLRTDCKWHSVIHQIDWTQDVICCANLNLRRALSARC